MDAKVAHIAFGEAAVHIEAGETDAAVAEAAKTGVLCDEIAKDSSGSTCSSTGDSLSECHSSLDLSQPDDSCRWPMTHSIVRDSTPSPRQFCELQQSGPLMALHFQSPSPSWYIVSYRGGIELRTEPRFDAPRTGIILKQNEYAPVNEEVDGGDGRIYLRLVDGRGWIFDDARLMPEDPSVVRGCWTAVPVAPPTPSPPAASCFLSTNAPQIPVSQFRVAYLGGIRIRTAPSIESPPTSAMLMQGEVFDVAEERQGADGRLYLKLCSQPGWAFDDSALMPQDPSVVRECMERPVASDNAARHDQKVQLSSHNIPPRRILDAASSNRLLATSPTHMETAEGWELDASSTRRGGARRSKRGNATSSRQHQSRRR